MSDVSNVDMILNQAREQEKEYDWLSAIESYKKALDYVPEIGILKIGQIQERIGYAFHRAAMQAENVDEFKDRMSQAAGNHKKAKEFYGRLNESEKIPWTLRCDAMIAYIGYWLTSEAPEKKKLLDECWKLAKVSLKAFKSAGNTLEFGKTYNQLSQSAVLGFVLEWNRQAREKIIRDLLEDGEQAITFLLSSEDPCELARACVKTASCLQVLGFYFLDLKKRDRHFQKARDYWEKANHISEETAMLELSSVLGGPSWDWGEGTEKALQNFRKALECSRKTKERFTGCALDWLAYHTFWKAWATEDLSERLKLAKAALQYAHEARHNYRQISFTSPRGGVLWIEAPEAEYYWFLADSEVDLSKRRDLLEKAAEAASEGLTLAENSRYPDIISLAHVASSGILTAMARIETDPEKKKSFLEEALKHRNESIGIIEQLEPFHYWDRGIMQNYLADMKSELADLANDPEIKKNTLQEAIFAKEASLKLCAQGIAFYEKEASVTLFASLGRQQFQYGNLLYRFYESTRSMEQLRKAIEAFRDAAESYGKLSLTSRMAECYWKIAQVYDHLSEHLEAAGNFALASDNYRSAAERIPQLKEFYKDHALYMQAWSEIEKGKYHHGRQEYGSAKDHFEKAAELHKTLKQWSHLTSNYLAWTQIERAEDLSRREHGREAMHAFEEAAKLFSETKTSLQIGLSNIENADEKQMATRLIQLTSLRRQYCIGRMALEEAIILDKKGDHYSSSQKYELAAENFEKITQALESEQDRKELKLICTLSRAWQKMTLAESEASPALYLEASQLFEEAKEFSPNEKAKMLALGHSRFCKALEAGTKFIDTRDAALHNAIIQRLGSAADYYVKAGFQNASEYAKATKLLFDAYVHICNAERETDPEKKAKLYTMAEKILQTSAGSFMKAEHPEKREQVLKLLEKVKEERELALSLSEVLHAPTIVSATTAFATPTPTHESAVGLEKFEHADIQANLITRQKELKVGESLNLEIELINAGKGPALLTKITEIIPEGFELTEKPEIYRVEDSYLNMKGKRLDPLRMEEVKLVLKPKVQGVFPLKPRILYLDENGKYKSHEPESITIKVKELGIKGWIKGER